ncbi:MAG: cell division protein SepF [Fusobacteriaceae bacterium]
MAKHQNLDIIFIRPTKFEDIGKYMDYIINDTIVHLNFESLDPKTAQRVIDFVSGAVFIKNGVILNPIQNIYCVIPEGTEYSMEYKTNPSNVVDSRNNEEEEIVPRFK